MLSHGIDPQPEWMNPEFLSRRG